MASQRHQLSPIIIAECAQGYAQPTIDESTSLAIWLLKSAHASGADIVKFQLIIADELCTKDYKHYNLFKSLEIGFNGWGKIAFLANQLGIKLAFDIFGQKSLDTAIKLGIDTVKIHPTDFSNTFFLSKIASNSGIKHVLAGCGGATLEEIKVTLAYLRNIPEITLLHGFQGYPTLTPENCLSRLKILSKLLNDDSSSNRRNLGFADHAEPQSSQSSHLPVLSLGYGVNVIEKHLTLARCLNLEDHESALSPDEFSDFVNTISDAYKAISHQNCSPLGFSMSQNELSYRKMVGRHVVASELIKKGSIIKAESLLLMRTSSEDPIYNLYDVTGKYAILDILPGIPITSDILKNE